MLWCVEKVELNFPQLWVETQHLTKRGRQRRKQNDSHEIVESRVHDETRDLERRLDFGYETTCEFEDSVGQNVLFALLGFRFHA